MDFQKVLCAVLFSFVAGVEGFRLLGSFRKSSSSLRMPMKMTQEPSFKSTAKDIVDMYAAEQQLAGKCAVVTGGNSGIGLETCKALASAGCKVVMCSRDVQAAESAIETELMQPGLGGYTLTPEQRSLVRVKQLDLADIRNVKAFSADLLKDDFVERIDYLVLNAGIMATPTRELTPQGFEKQIGVNHFGHAQLVQDLYAKLTSADNTRQGQVDAVRVVTVASSAHQFGELLLDNLHYNDTSRGYTPWGAYGQSKLANILFAKGLSQKFEKDGHAESVTSVSLHPGVIRTPLWKNTPLRWSFLGALSDLFSFTSKTIPMGAATTVFACLSPRVGKSEFRGAYLSDCAAYRPQEKAIDQRNVLGLWEETEKQLAAVRDIVDIR